jgi:hypothetical protein
MKKHLILLLTIIIPILSFAQILNVENLRLKTDTSGLFGVISLNSDVNNNINNSKLNINLEYKKINQIYKFVNNNNIISNNNNNILNEGFSHFRFSQRIKNNLLSEFYIQHQYNNKILLKFSNIVGFGIRTKIKYFKNLKINYGLSLMFVSEKIDTTFYKNKVLNNYVSFSWLFNDKIKIISTSYLQYNLTKSDFYKFLSDAKINFYLIKKFSYNLGFYLSYNELKVNNIDNILYGLFNSINYKL